MTIRVAGRSRAARSVQVGEVISYQASTGRIHSFAEVDQLVVKSRFKGALHGLGIGVLAGGAMGALAGFSSGGSENDECNGPEPCFGLGRGATTAVMGLAGGLVGGVVGIVLGTAVGATDVYERPRSRVTVGGPGGTSGLTISF